MGDRGGPGRGREHHRGSGGGVSRTAWTQANWSCPGTTALSAGRQEEVGAGEGKPLPAFLVLERPLVVPWVAGGSVGPDRSCRDTQHKQG
jgi:hypothetical protein